MGYGLGVFLLAVGLILVFAISDTVNGIDLHTVGWILALAGVVVIALTALTMNRARRATTVARTTHADGSQTVTEQSSRQDTPPVA
jgi:hypothetical protein